MTHKLFKDVAFDPALYEKVLKRPAAGTRYVIYFTPRSGSSWLTDILSQTQRLSKANEAFNPNFIPNIARVCNASNLEQYINVMVRRHNQKGVYGFEITMHQLNAVFPDHETFLDSFGAGPCFWLIRRDIVAQAISLAKMVKTNVAHTSHASSQDLSAADAAFAYDARLIRKWLNHILSTEEQNEKLFATHGLSPLRMCYEQTTQLSNKQMVNVIARHVGVTDLPEIQFQTSHAKLGTDLNDTFAARFRAEEAAFMAEVDAKRARMLAKLDDITRLL